MIIVPVKEGDNIERALKKFKRKTEKTGVIKELRTRQAVEKPSITNRTKMKTYSRTFNNQSGSYGNYDSRICQKSVRQENLAKPSRIGTYERFAEIRTGLGKCYGRHIKTGNFNK